MRLTSGSRFSNAFNFFPAYRRTGGRICFLSTDWKEIHVSLRMKRTTKNYVGSVFGGSIYGALDPIYMVQLINLLGRGYVVWDKSANIRFIKPVRSKVFARFLITSEILDEIRAKIAAEKKYDVELKAFFQDAAGTVYSEITKTIYIADREYYRSARQGRQTKDLNS